MSSQLPRLGALSFRELLDEGVRAVRHRFRPLFLPFAVPVALAGGLIALLQARMFGALHASGPSLPDMLSLVWSFGPVALATVLYVLMFLVVNLAMQAAMVWAVEGGHPGASPAYRWAVRVRVLWTEMLKLGLIGLGLLCCVAPGLVLILRLWLVEAVMASEGSFGVAALKRAMKLVAHNPERRLATSPQVKVLAIALTAWLVSSVVSMAVNLPFTIVQQLIMLRGIASAEGAADPGGGFGLVLWLQVPQSLLGGLVTVAVLLYGCALTALLFVDLRRRMEGEDIEEALDALGAPGLGERSALSS